MLLSGFQRLFILAVSKEKQRHTLCNLKDMVCTTFAVLDLSALTLLVKCIFQTNLTHKNTNRST